MKLFNITTLLLLGITQISFAGGSQSGGTGFLCPPQQLKNHQNSENGTSGGGFVFNLQQVKNVPDQKDSFNSDFVHLAGGSESDGTFLIQKASLELSEGRSSIAERVIRQYRPELTSYFSEIRPLIENTNSGIVKTPIHQSLTATFLNNYGGYGEDEAIEAVLEAPEAAEAEVRQIIYSL